MLRESTRPSSELGSTREPSHLGLVCAGQLSFVALPCAAVAAPEHRHVASDASGAATCVARDSCRVSIARRVSSAAQPSACPCRRASRAPRHNCYAAVAANFPFLCHRSDVYAPARPTASLTRRLPGGCEPAPCSSLLSQGVSAAATGDGVCLPYSSSFPPTGVLLARVYQRLL